MELSDRIWLESQKTAGYSEAQDKKSFMVGVSVALSKAETHYEEEIKLLKMQVDYYKSHCDIYAKDLSTLTSIISRYTEEK